MARRKYNLLYLLIISLAVLMARGAFAEPLTGGTLDPTTIPKYETSLVIPPVMKNMGTQHPALHCQGILPCILPCQCQGVLSRQ